MNVSPISDDLYNSPKLHCMKFKNPDGSPYYLSVLLPSKNTNTRRAAREKLFNALPMYSKETFTSAPDGVYTWILSDKGFFAVKVLSVLEHATLHLSIVDRTHAARIKVAGEAIKEGMKLSVNLLSGTYTARILEASANKNTTEKAMEDEIFSFLSSLGFDVTIDKSLKTYITQPPTEDELKLYAAAGYDVKLYKTKDACEKWKRSTLQRQLDTVITQMARPMFASASSQEKFTKQKEELEAKIAEIDSNVPVHIRVGGKSHTRRHHRRQRIHGIKKQSRKHSRKYSRKN